MVSMEHYQAPEESSYPLADPKNMRRIPGVIRALKREQESGEIRPNEARVQGVGV